MIKRLAAALAWSSLMAVASTAHAGPWTKSLGHAYVKLSEGFFLSDSFVDPQGQLQQGTDFLGTTTAVYAEVGVYQNLHVQLWLPHVVFRNAFDNGDRFLTAGGGDANLGLQWSPALLPFAHAIRADFKIPLYDIANPRGPERPRFPQRGDGQVDATVWLSAGDSIPGTPVYAFAEIGHRFRTEAFMGEGAERSYADSLAFAAQVGVTPLSPFIVAANVSGTVPYVSDDLTKGYLTLGGSIYAPVYEGLALEANLDTIAWARNSSAGLSFGFGVSYAL